MDLGQKADLLKSKPLYIVDLHQANLDRIEGEIAKLKTKYGICGFYLDYLKEFYYPDLEKSEEFDNWDCISLEHKMFIELKSRKTHYPDLLIN